MHVGEPGISEEVVRIKETVGMAVYGSGGRG